jgi:hypothetical protein
LHEVGPAFFYNLSLTFVEKQVLTGGEDAYFVACDGLVWCS